MSKTTRYLLERVSVIRFFVHVFLQQLFLVLLDTIGSSFAFHTYNNQGVIRMYIKVTPRCIHYQGVTHSTPSVFTTGEQFLQF
jgi:hypothetical protein